MQFKVTQKLDSSRQEYHAARYHIDKRVKVLQSGKHGKNISRFMGRALFEIYEANRANKGEVYNPK